MEPRAVVFCLTLWFVASKGDEVLFDNERCGYVQSNAWPAISPWLASIRAVDLDSLYVFPVCSGALINRRYVVTLAECLIDKDRLSVLMVQLGTTTVHNYTGGGLLPEGAIRVLYRIEKKIPHPLFKPETGVHNIGLIQLSRQAQYSDSIQPICLPFRASIPAVGSTAYASIWDEIYFSSFPRSKASVSSTLIKVDEVITCRTEDTKKAMCDAYLGSPLVFERNKQYSLLGILTKTTNCQGAYFNVFNYREWIKANVQSNYDQCTTPTNEQRRCVPIRDCPVLVHAFANPKQKYEEHLRQYVCSNDEVGGLQVCCPRKLDSIELQADSTNLESLSRKAFCGYQHRDDYLSEDSDISLDEFPWLATLRVLDGFNVEHAVCSGSLIDNRHVLTSSYCVDHFGKIVSVRLGEYNILNKTACISVPQIGDDCSTVEEFGVEKIIQHPFYNYWTTENDLAIVKLNRTVLFSDYIRPICLPISSMFASEKASDEFYTTSFTSPKPWGTDHMKKKLYYTLADGDVCENRTQPMAAYRMCLLPKAMHTDRFMSCYDDNGAPAMTSSKAQWILRGILTGKRSLCAIIDPIILSRTSSYLPWIHENVKN